MLQISAFLALAALILFVWDLYKAQGRLRKELQDEREMRRKLLDGGLDVLRAELRGLDYACQQQFGRVAADLQRASHVAVLNAEAHMLHEDRIRKLEHNPFHQPVRRDN